jgi:hypothetical protein
VKKSKKTRKKRKKSINWTQNKIEILRETTFSKKTPNLSKKWQKNAKKHTFLTLFTIFLIKFTNMKKRCFPASAPSSPYLKIAKNDKK